MLGQRMTISRDPSRQRVPILACGVLHLSLTLDEILVPWPSDDGLAHGAQMILASLDEAVILASDEAVILASLDETLIPRAPFGALQGSLPAALIFSLVSVARLSVCSPSSLAVVALASLMLLVLTPRTHLGQRDPHHPVHLLCPPRALLQDPHRRHQMTTHGAKRIKRPVAKGMMEQRVGSLETG